MKQTLNEQLKNKKVLVLVPHPDDEMIGMGGTLALLKDSEVQVDCVCICSSGIPSPDKKYSAKERNEMRLEEWNQVMTELGVHSHSIHSVYGDDFPFVETLKKDMKEIEENINISDYDFIFVPSFFEQHEEHRFLTYVLLPDLLKKSKNKRQRIALYEVWSLQSVVSDYIDISDYIDEKMRLIRLYKSQCDYTDYDNRIEGLNKYRGLMGGRVKYAEAFEVLSRHNFELVSHALRIVLNARKLWRKMKER